jgi:hypothetical protein
MQGGMEMIAGMITANSPEEIAAAVKAQVCEGSGINHSAGLTPVVLGFGQHGLLLFCGL